MLNFEAPTLSSESGLCLSPILFTPPILTFGEGNDSPLQYSCLENSMDRGAWWGIVHEVAKSDTTQGIFPTKESNQGLLH